MHHSFHVIPYSLGPGASSDRLDCTVLCSVLSSVLRSVLSSVPRFCFIAVHISCEFLLFMSFTVCGKALWVRALVLGSCNVYRHAARLNMT